jgi:uncharacterized protein (TIGR02996 family)
MTTLDPAALQHHLEQLPPLADDPAYLVFADWLQSQGHPWGELVVLHHRAAIAEAPGERAALERAAAHLLEARGADILGGPPRAEDELIWHLGFVRRARLVTAADPGAILAAARGLLASPAARMLEALVLEPRPERFDTSRRSTWAGSPPRCRTRSSASRARAYRTSSCTTSRRWSERAAARRPPPAGGYRYFCGTFSSTGLAATPDLTGIT